HPRQAPKRRGGRATPGAATERSEPGGPPSGGPQTDAAPLAWSRGSSRSRSPAFQRFIRPHAVAHELLRVLRDCRDVRTVVDFQVLEEGRIVPAMRKQVEHEAWNGQRESTGPIDRVLTAPLLPEPRRVPAVAEMMAAEIVRPLGPHQVLAAHADVGRVAPELDVRPIAMDGKLPRGPVDLLRVGEEHAVVRIEVDDVDRDQILGGVRESPAQRIELPLRDELIAIELHTPVAGTSLPRFVLELAVPLHAPLLAPLAPEHLNLRIDVRDSL